MKRKLIERAIFLGERGYQQVERDLLKGKGANAWRIRLAFEDAIQTEDPKDYFWEEIKRQQVVQKVVDLYDIPKDKAEMIIFKVFTQMVQDKAVLV